MSLCGSSSATADAVALMPAGPPVLALQAFCAVASLTAPDSTDLTRNTGGCHLLCSAVKGAPEEGREGNDIVDLVGEVAAACGNDDVRPRRYGCTGQESKRHTTSRQSCQMCLTRLPVLDPFLLEFQGQQLILGKKVMQ